MLQGVRDALLVWERALDQQLWLVGAMPCHAVQRSGHAQPSLDGCMAARGAALLLRLVHDAL
ncbi:hypothetical protein [Mumia zhuanghuii]|uniref:Uncharacterized protein n=1 Tax=Mumia zhuanghuii TaxID=2585211 RepID=A0A5C4M9G4_9ACTN|nr:hypothetical protein [Mumia zhuanghuii]TNC28428.1 hypothetical protein FHE65_33955 [Mumia zhuanghuii]